MPAIPATPASGSHTDQPIQTSKGDPTLRTTPAEAAPSDPQTGSPVSEKGSKLAIPIPQYSKDIADPGKSDSRNAVNGGSRDPQNVEADPAVVQPAVPSVNLAREIILCGNHHYIRATVTALQGGQSGKVPIAHGSTRETSIANGPAATIGAHIASTASDDVIIDTKIHGLSAIDDLPEGLSRQKGFIIPMGSISMTLRPMGTVSTLYGQIISAASNSLIVGTATVPINDPLSSAIASNSEKLVLASNDIVASGTYGGFAEGAPPSRSATALFASITVLETAYTVSETSIPSQGEGSVVAEGSAKVTVYPGEPAETIDGKAVSVAVDGLVIGGEMESVIKLENTVSTGIEGETSSVVTTATNAPSGDGGEDGWKLQFSTNRAVHSGSEKLRLSWDTLIFYSLLIIIGYRPQ
ncbi:MAG: hypothetical protein Q9165_007608 [Trypethelium subeluteriae]